LVNASNSLTVLKLKSYWVKGLKAFVHWVVVREECVYRRE